MSESGAEIDPVTCDDVRAWMAVRLASRASSIDDGLVRSHLARCEDCRGAYRMQMSDLARIGHAARRSKVNVSPGTAALERPRLTRKHRAVLLLVAVSATIFAVSRVGHGLRADPTLPVEWLRGEFWVAGEPVGVGFGPRMGLRGDLLQTGVDGLARLSFDKGRIEIEPSTTLVVESAVTERVRFVGGAVRLFGDACLGTPFGLIELEGGTCGVTLVGDELKVVTLSGTAIFVNADGERRIAASTSYVFEGGRGSNFGAGRAQVSASGH